MVQSCFVVLAFGALALGGCKEPEGIEIDPRLLIPKEAAVAVGFEVAPIRDSPAGQPMRAALDGDEDMNEVVVAIEACDLDVSALRGLMALNASADRFFGAVEAPGIGEEKMVRCLETELAKAGGESTGLLLFQTKGKVRALPQEDGGYLIILNKNMIAFVDETWEDEVFAAIESEAARNTESFVVKAAAKIDLATDLWFTYELSDSDRADLGEVPGVGELRGIAASCDLASGLKVDLRLDFGDDANAGVFTALLPALLEELEPSLSEAGLPASLLDGVKPKTADGVVSADLVISADAFPGVVAAVGPMLAE